MHSQGTLVKDCCIVCVQDDAGRAQAAGFLAAKVSEDLAEVTRSLNSCQLEHSTVVQSLIDVQEQLLTQKDISDKKSVKTDEETAQHKALISLLEEDVNRRTVEDSTQKGELFGLQQEVVNLNTELQSVSQNAAMLAHRSKVGFGESNMYVTLERGLFFVYDCDKLL